MTGSQGDIDSPLERMLARSHWARCLDDAQLARVRRDVAIRPIAANGFVCRRGEPADAWIGVVDGLVKISSASFEGKLVTFTGVPAGGWLGEGSLLKDEDRRYDVIALRDSLVAYVPRETFLWLLDCSIRFNRFVLSQINERLGQFIAMVEIERLLAPEARVARCIAQMFNPLLYPGGGPGLEISQVELGFLTGLSRQRVNRALARLQSDGLLEVGYGGIWVPDVSRLAAYEG